MSRASPRLVLSGATDGWRTRSRVCSWPMRFITTKTHGVLDYVVGVLLILAPFIFGFANGGPAMWVPIILGAGTLLYSACTNYELGLTPAISMPAHLTLDFIGGAFLAASPWLFNFHELVWAPHLVVGLFEIGASLMTHKTPSESGVRRTAAHHHS